MRVWRRLWLRSQYVVQQQVDQLRALARIGPATIPLETVQRRLELVLAGVYGRSIPIAPIETNVWDRERVRNLARGDIRGAEATPSVDGTTIFLPAELNARGSTARTIERYRLFALEQAERIVRGTVAHAPTDPLERDLYMLREGEAIDAHLARTHPGVTQALGAERESLLAKRPKLEELTPAEQDVERLVRGALARSPDAPGEPASSPEASREWARERAAQIRRRGGGYRCVLPVVLWGTMRSSDELPTRQEDVSKHAIGGTFDRVEQESEDGAESEGEGESRAKDEADPAEGESHAPGADAARTTDRERAAENGPQDAVDGIDPQRLRELDIGATLPPATYYDEWNTHRGVYEKRAAAVRVYPAVEGDAAWARAALASNRATVAQVRQQFERLRARRTLLSRQRAGDELDIRAAVDAFVDHRTGTSPDDRLYLDARPARRGLAISLLVDVSGSTDARATAEWRIIDLEKIALLVATQALDTLGDLYAVYAFAGKSAHNVKLTVVKDFAERSGETVQRRIAALEPGGFTRLGAAVRHATLQLTRQSAGHRLLLLLSDGRPNDIEGYGGDYGVEDSRQAIVEARASGVYPFCLTIDAQASEYLPRIFGAAGHTILTQPRQLPTALLRVVRTLIKR